jgi:muconolactone delta-isomerase
LTFIVRRMNREMPGHMTSRKLTKAAGLESELSKARATDKDLDAHWKSAGNWRPSSRYERKTTEETYALFAAISDTDHGVFACIKRLW